MVARPRCRDRAERRRNRTPRTQLRGRHAPTPRPCTSRSADRWAATPNGLLLLCLSNGIDILSAVGRVKDRGAGGHNVRRDSLGAPVPGRCERSAAAEQVVGWDLYLRRAEFTWLADNLRQPGQLAARRRLSGQRAREPPR